MISGLANQGLKEMWDKIVEHRTRFMATGEFTARRRAQDVKWMWAMIEDRLMGRLRDDRTLRARLPEIEQAVADGTLTATAAAEDVLTHAGLA